MSSNHIRSSAAAPLGWQAEMSRWLAALTYEDLSSDLVNAALRSIIDVVGVGLAGSRTDIGQLLAKRLRGQSANPIATAIGFEFSLGRLDAALLNATTSHVLDFDDTSYSLIGHSSAVVFPAVLAAAESASAERSGKDLLLAFVAGTEVVCRLGRLMNPKLFQAGWFTTAAVGVFGAAVAAAKIWDLPPEQFGAAIAIAGGQSGGTRANNGTMTKPILCGIAARAGVEAADLAGAGIGAAADVFHGHDGFLAVHGFDSAEEVGRPWRMGSDFELLVPGMAIKRYPCCSAIAAAVDALLELKHDARLEWQNVIAVECRATGQAKQSLPYIHPANWREAQFSLHYCLAWALVFGRLDIDAFRENSVDVASVRNAMGRVRVTYDLEHSSSAPEAAFVKLRTQDGRTFQKTILQAIGTPERPLADEKLCDKFRTCSRQALSSSDAEALLDALWHLPRHSVTGVSRLLRCTGVRS